MPVNDLMLESLDRNHYAVIPNFIEGSAIDELLRYAISKSPDFKSAMIGKGRTKQLLKTTRNSSIEWIDKWDSSAAHQEIRDKLHLLSTTLNRHFYLSLKSFESQFSFYPIGGYYKKHKDQLDNNKTRQLTAVLFLNDVYSGGELVIYSKDNINKIDTIIPPRAGTLVLFFSSTIFHEVQFCQEERYGLTTWFRDDEIDVPFSKNERFLHT